MEEKEFDNKMEENIEKSQNDIINGIFQDIESDLTDNEQESDEKQEVENQTINEETPEGQMGKLKSEINALNDKYLRLAAEYDNYRKRTLKERMDLIKTAGEDILQGLLPVIDNMERGIKQLSNTTDYDALKTGMELIHSQFKDFLKQKGIKEIEIKDHCFDVDFHEAITKVPAPQEELKGKVVDVVEKGYMLHDKVIRFAKVVIGE